MKNDIYFRSEFLKWGCITLALFTGFYAAVGATDYLGANGVLQQVKERNAQPGAKSGGDESAKLREELKAFSSTATNLAPAEAAKRWLELADRAVKLQRQAAMDYSSGSQRLEFNDLLGALPPPPAWSELAKAIAARPAVKGEGELREIGLRFLAATLTGDKDAQNREIARLSAKAKEAGIQSAFYYRNYLEQISQTLMAMSDNPDAVLKNLEREMESTRVERGRPLKIPNLVAQVGAEKAGAFLRKALVAPNVFLTFRQSDETSQLAQKLAKELLPQLKQAQWGVINSLSAVELYEAMEKQFPAATNKAAALSGITGGDLRLPDDLPGNPSDDYKKQGAQIYYLLGLISEGRSKDAVALAKKLDGRAASYEFEAAFKAMQRAGFMAAMDDFFNELLTQNPALPFWDQFVETAAQAGTTKRMLATVRTALNNADLSEGKKNALHQILFKALLADDSVDEAVTELRRLLTADETEAGRDGMNAGQLGALLAQLGVLLEKPEWTEEGIKAARDWLAKSAGKNNGESENVSGTIAEVLSGLNRGPEAEAVLVDALAAATAPSATARNNYWPSSPAVSALTELAALYHQAGRHADVLHLLEYSADWGAGDVSELFNNTPGENRVTLMFLHTGTSPLPLPYLAAKALLANGKTEAAQKITDALLDKYPGLDRGYELLLALQGTNAIARLDELFKRDQFEERPLIWKAHLLREQNQLEAAEKLLRQAISIDPSDGEEGRGDRMRVYAELAEVREARGDKKEADFFREVVKAIRLSEHADQFYAVGLLKRAVAMYAEGLTHFSDAYCIQSRMAIQLSALGLNAEAEEHYRRAYELMPDSFGRVESHCFGCEKAFDGERPQSIAEKVFTKMAAERPDKPQIHYLLGYLREEQERYNEARTNYLTAVRLDPDYLNAWVKIQGVSQQILMPPKERAAIAFNILRLDPLQRHAQPDGSRVTDLAGFWNAVAAAVAQQPAASTNLFALPASKLALGKKQKEQPDNFSYSSYAEREFSPAGAIAQNPFIMLAGQMILNGGQAEE
jgi:tetratricopeptide (TPR) repeat protein